MGNFHSCPTEGVERARFRLSPLPLGATSLLSGHFLLHLATGPYTSAPTVKGLKPHWPCLLLHQPEGEPGLCCWSRLTQQQEAQKSPGNGSGVGDWRGAKYKMKKKGKAKGKREISQIDKSLLAMNNMFGLWICAPAHLGSGFWLSILLNGKK